MQFLLKRMTWLLLLLQVHAAWGQEQVNGNADRYNSLLWEITGNGLTRPSYLYGTMHVSQKVAFHLTDTFFLALNKCNAIALEEDPGMWMEELIESGFLTEFRSNSFSRRNGNFYRNAFQIELPDNKDYSQTLSFQSDLMNSLLYRYYSREGNFEENTYLDLFIYQCARKIGKPVIGLETFAEGQEYSLKASMPDSVKKENDSWIGSSRDLREQIEDAYRKGDLDRLDSLSRISSRSRNMQKYLIDERNRIFTDKMDSVMRTSTTLFTGVGAAHLPGTNGVITLLRNKGYHVRAVAFTQSKKADKEKQKIENTFRPNTFSLQHFPDSSVSLMAPGKLYKLMGGSNSFYIYPDMVNGAYYSAFAMNRFEPFTKHSMDYSLQRIDSLLYENVPGKILSKKYSRTPGGFPCIDLTNRSRRGDASRYRIIVTPEYIYFFIVNGTGDHALDNEHDKFFEDIQVPAADRGREWKRIYGEAGGYSLEMPGHSFNDVLGGSSTYRTNDAFIHSFHPADSSYYLFVRNDYPDVEYLEEDTFELLQLAEEFAEQFEMTLDTPSLSFARPEQNGHPSLRAALQKDSTRYFIRIVIQGPHYNLLCCKTGKDDACERFLSSFRAEPMQYKTPFEEVKDTAMHFTVTSFPEKQMVRSLKAMRASYDNDDDDDYASDKVKKRTFKSPASDEYIHVIYRKFTPFYQPRDSASFWNQQVDDVNEDSSMLVTDKKMVRQDSLDILTFVLRDTACTRAIRFKMILRKDALYTLSTPVDTLVEPGNWATTFFHSFAPDDTAAAQSIFTSKTAAYFDHLFSTDSARIKVARRNFWRARMDSTQVPKMIAWMRDSASLRYTSSLRENMIHRIGVLNHPETLPFLKQLYSESGDSSGIQIAILGALAQRKTREATQLFKELLLKEAPLSGETFQISSMFDQYYDTLELASLLYPEVLRLTRYPEYKTELYALLAATTLNRKIQYESYRPYLADILHDAQDELKREFHADKEDDDNVDYTVGRNLRGSMRRYDFRRNNDYEYHYTSGQPDLYEHFSQTEDLAILLIPFYESENSVRNFFHKFQKGKNQELVMRSQVLMLHDTLPVPDSTWKHYSASRDMRAKLYAELKRFNRLDKFDTTFSSQSHISESLLSNELEWNKDSVQFLEKRFIRSKRDSGYVYIYKYKREKSGKWQLGYNYLQPGNPAEVAADSECRSESIRDMAKLEKQITRLCKRLALADRPRAGSGNASSYSDD